MCIFVSLCVAHTLSSLFNPVVQFLCCWLQRFKNYYLLCYRKRRSFHCPSNIMCSCSPFVIDTVKVMTLYSFFLFFPLRVCVARQTVSLYVPIIVTTGGGLFSVDALPSVPPHFLNLVQLVGFRMSAQYAHTKKTDLPACWKVIENCARIHKKNSRRGPFSGLLPEGCMIRECLNQHHMCVFHSPSGRRRCPTLAHSNLPPAS